MAEAADALQLRSFLRQRCGSLKAGFATLATSESGQLNREEFETGLRKLGFRADALGLFQSMDPSGCGRVNLKAFVTGLMGEPGIECAPSRSFPRHSYHAGMGTPRKLENSFAPTLLQRAAGPKSGPKAEPAKILKSQSEAETLNVSSLGARVAQLELQLAIEQQSRVDMEKRLNQELERLQQLIRDELPPRPDSAQQRASLALSISCPSCPQMGRESDALASGSRADAKAQSPGSEDARADTFPRPASQEKQKVPRLQLTPRTMLRQENLALREQILTLREQAVDAKERERSHQGGGRPSSARADASEGLGSGGISGHKAAAPSSGSPQGQALTRYPRTLATSGPQKGTRMTLPGQYDVSTPQGLTSQHRFMK